MQHADVVYRRDVRTKYGLIRRELVISVQVGGPADERFYTEQNRCVLSSVQKCDCLLVGRSGRVDDEHEA